MKEKVIVLCLNDFPIGVYSSEKESNAAKEVDCAERKKLNFSPMLTLHYHVHEFIVDAEARF